MIQPMTRHVDLVQQVAKVVDPPPAWTTLLDRFNTFTAMTGSAGDRLAAAVVEGDDTVSGLRTLALAEAAGEATPTVVAAVINRVRAEVLPKLEAIIAEHSDAIFNAVADGYDAIAEKFTAAARLADPESDAETMVNANAKQRAAWSEAPVLAAQLDEVIPAVQAAAKLCGADGPDNTLTLLPLVIDPDGCHRRVVWEAFNSTGRAGRWSAVVAADIPIRCHRDPAAIEPYRLCKPFEERSSTRNGEHRTYWVDPEDDGYQAPEQPFAFAGQGLIVK